MMALMPGKANSIAAGVEGDDRREYVSHAPVFVGFGEAPANSVSGERLQPARPVARPVVSRTRAEAQAKGLGGPEALDLTADEIAAWVGIAPRSTETAETGVQA